MKNGMPKRPREHQVEDLSIVALKEKLPREWVYREKEKDYGIDGEIEIFDNDGYATGLVFLVQLKATDNTDIKKQKRVQLSTESINYYSSLELPTLIIRYIEQSNIIYYRWSYKIDVNKIKENAKSFSFLMDEEEKWRNNTPEALHSELLKLRDIKKSNTLLPLKIYFDFKFTKFLDSTPYVLKSYIRNYIQDKSRFIDIVLDKKEAICLVDMTNNVLITSIASFVVNTINDYSKLNYITYESFISDLFILISMNLFGLGKGTDAIHILKHCIDIKKSYMLLNNPNMALSLIQYLIVMKEENLAFQLWNNLSDEVQIEMKPFFSILLLKTESLETYKIFLKEEIKIGIQNEDNVITGTSCYNLANIFHNDSKHKEAIKYYNLALKYHQDYFKKDYLFKEIGGSLFELRKYSTALKYYKCGLELKEDLKTIILYADTLMMVGEYQESLDYMQKYFDNNDEIEDEWILKSFVLEFFIDDLNISSQKRSYFKAMETDTLMKIGIDTVSEEDLLSVLKIDALSPLSWYNLAQMYSKKQEFSKAMVGFLISGLINGYDPEAWYNSFVMAIYSTEVDLVEPIIRVGYQKSGEEFIRYVYNSLEEINQEVDNEELIESIYTQIEEIISEKDIKEPIFRIHDVIESI